jgi:eukaryotic-like serine/threonine-protein kinase
MRDDDRKSGQAVRRAEDEGAKPPAARPGPVDEPPAVSLKPGDKVGGYTIQRHLASGGMGEVYEALQPLTERLVALKILRPAARTNANATRRYVKEVRTLGSLEHASIVTIHHADQDPIVGPYFIMELLQGMTLAQFIRGMGGPISVSRTYVYGIDLTHALARLHDLGVVHRDLKPDNVFLQKGRGPKDRWALKLLDLGLAATQLKGVERTTGANIVVGTPPYSSPEQIRAEKVDGRSDVYALGIVLHEMLCGRLPYQQNHVGVPKHSDWWSWHLYAPVPSVPEDMPWIKDYVFAPVRRCLQKDRELRYPSMGELCGALYDVLQQWSKDPDREKEPRELRAGPDLRHTDQRLASMVFEPQAPASEPEPAFAPTDPAAPLPPPPAMPAPSTTPATSPLEAPAITQVSPAAPPVEVSTAALSVEVSTAALSVEAEAAASPVEAAPAAPPVEVSPAAPPVEAAPAAPPAEAAAGHAGVEMRDALVSFHAGAANDAWPEPQVSPILQAPDPTEAPASEPPPSAPDSGRGVPETVFEESPFNVAQREQRENEARRAQEAREEMVRIERERAEEDRRAWARARAAVRPAREALAGMGPQRAGRESATPEAVARPAQRVSRTSGGRVRAAAGAAFDEMRRSWRARALVALVLGVWLGCLVVVKFSRALGLGASAEPQASAVPLLVPVPTIAPSAEPTAAPIASAEPAPAPSLPVVPAKAIVRGPVSPARAPVPKVPAPIAPVPAAPTAAPAAAPAAAAPAPSEAPTPRIKMIYDYPTATATAAPPAAPEGGMKPLFILPKDGN